jgi:hypothetical protein
MKCVVCNKDMPFASDEYNVRHYFHDDDCPNHKVEMGHTVNQGDYVECQCDNPCHQDCCPVCTHIAKERAAIQSKLSVI